MKIAIAGAAGRMGQTLVRAALGEGHPLTGASEQAGPSVGKDAAKLAGLDPYGVLICATPGEAAKGADVWIDFTRPAATLAALAALPGAGVRVAVIGTTGFSADQETMIRTVAESMTVVKAGNFSVGVTLAAALTERAARVLGPDWDIEISETHHRHKIDAPSGTALLLGEAAAKGRGNDLSSVRTPPYDGLTGARQPGRIGFSVRRAGGVIGAHEVMFASEAETLSISHDALDRTVFATGALVAARWAQNQPYGLYDMRDVLGL
jgi:4-hydroxy-tetrahydrodipicolinate reductase